MASQYPGGGSGVFFYREAADLERALRNDASPRARELSLQAKRLAEVFDDWAKLRAEPARKATAVRELFELNRAVLEYLGASSGRKLAPTVARAHDDDDDDT
jgi:hypothetical protein